MTGFRFANEKDASRYTLHRGDDLVSVLDYRDDGRTIALTRAYTIPAFRGHGYAAEVVARAVAGASNDPFSRLRFDAAALGAAQGAPGLDATLARFDFMNEVLEWHAEGEEEAVFTALEGIAPRLAWAYDQDHRGLDAAFAEFTRCMSLRDPVQTARATAAFTFHLDLHLAKEDAQVYPLVIGALSSGLAALLAVTGWVDDDALRGWPATLIGYPAAVTVPLAFATMVVISRLTRQSVPADVARIFARMLSGRVSRVTALPAVFVTISFTTASSSGMLPGKS